VPYKQRVSALADASHASAQMDIDAFFRQQLDDIEDEEMEEARQL
jgi:hypothetical protein